LIRKVRKKPEKTSEFEDLGKKNTSKTPKFGDLGKEKIPRYSLWRVRRGGKSIKNAGFSELHRQVDEAGEGVWGVWVRKKSIKNAGFRIKHAG